MNPQEQYERNLWWLIQQIKLEQLFGVDGKPIDFSLKVWTDKKKPNEYPSVDSQRKMLHKLQQLKVLKLQPSSIDPLDFPILGEPNRYALTINQAVFDDLYQTFETKFGFETTEEEKPEPVRTYAQPVIKDAALELMADDLSTHNSHATLTDFFKELEIPAGIEQEGSKKVRALSVMKVLALTDKDKLFHLIEEAVHPLRFGANDELAKTMVEKYNNFIKYDGWQIVLLPENGFVPKIIPAGTINQVIHDGEKGIPQDPDKISLLRQAYQVLMNIVEIFCYNPTEPDVKLNRFYTYLDKLIWETIDELRIHNLFYQFRKPFSNLFAAEKECGGKVAWDVFRPEMQAMFGQIESLYQEQNGSDILAEPDTQKQLNDIKLYLSEIKGKLKETIKQQKPASKPTIPIEIVNMPQVKQALDLFQGNPLKKQIFISDESGVYTNNGSKKLSYPISGKRAQLLKLLKDSKKSGPVLAQNLDQSLQVISKEIENINQAFRSKLEVEDDLISPIDTGGYKLNQEVFEIEFL